MDEDVARAEQAEHAQRRREGVPNTQLPNIARRVGMCTLIRRLRAEDGLNEPHGGRRGGSRVDTNALRRRSAGSIRLNTHLEEAVCALARNCVESVQDGDRDQKPLEEVGLERMLVRSWDILKLQRSRRDGHLPQA